MNLQLIQQKNKHGQSKPGKKKRKIDVESIIEREEKNSELNDVDDCQISLPSLNDITNNSNNSNIIKQSRQKPQIIRSPDALLLPQKASKKLCDELDVRVSEWIYFRRLPFDTVESDEFKSLYGTAVPGYKLPGRKVIAGRLLDECYTRMIKRVHKVMYIHSLTIISIIPYMFLWRQLWYLNI